MKWRTEWKWLSIFGLISIIIIGLMTNFRFNELQIQNHDTYYLIGSFKSIIFTTLFLWTIKNLYYLIDVLLNKYKVFAILIAILTPIAILLGVLFIYLNIQELLVFKEMYPDLNFLERIIPTSIITGLLILLVLIEIKSLKHALDLIKNQST